MLCTWFVYPFLKITSVSVNEPDFVNTAQLQTYINSTIIDHPFWSPFMPTFKSNLKSNFPQIDTLQVSLSRNLSLQLTLESKPPWVGCLIDQDIYLFSKDGIWLNQTETFQNEAVLNAIPIIKKLEKQQISAANWSEFSTKVSPLISALSDAFSDQNLQIYQTTSRDWVLLYDDLIPIRLGTASNIKQKLDSFITFKKHIWKPTDKITAIDLRIPDKLFVHYK
ncbi:cell division protein FtsQ [bacterium]|nr:cell division protein FtsQ [bacterium]